MLKTAFGQFFLFGKLMNYITFNSIKKGAICALLNLINKSYSLINFLIVVSLVEVFVSFTK